MVCKQKKHGMDHRKIISFIQTCGAFSMGNILHMSRIVGLLLIVNLLISCSSSDGTANLSVRLPATHSTTAAKVTSQSSSPVWGLQPAINTASTDLSGIRCYGYWSLITAKKMQLHNVYRTMATLFLQLISF